MWCRMRIRNNPKKIYRKICYIDQVPPINGRLERQVSTQPDRARPLLLNIAVKARGLP